MIDLKVIAMLPVKVGSKRLPDKNFKEIVPGRALWEETLRLLMDAVHAGFLQDIFISTNDVSWACQEKDQYHIPKKKGQILPGEIAIFEEAEENREVTDYRMGKTLGGTIANAMDYLNQPFFKNVKFDYLLVPQVDIVPKFPYQIKEMIEFAQESKADYIVSADTDGHQVGAWRMVKNPLNLEPLGQTIGMVRFADFFIDIHYQEDLEKAQKLYKKLLEDGDI